MTKVITNTGPLYRPTSNHCGFCNEDLGTYLGLEAHMSLRHGKIKLERHCINEEVVAASRGWYSIVDMD